MTHQLTDRGLTEISAGLAQAQAVLRRRRQHLQERMAGIEAEIAELERIETSIPMALEVLRATAAARERAASST